MNELKNDKCLQEAVNRREQKMPPLSDELNEKLLSDLSSLEPENQLHSRPFSLWRGWGMRLLVAAVAASIALLIVFNVGKTETPQEPLVAQQMVKPTTAASQPAVEEAQPAVVADGQPEELPVTEVSETAAPTAEPTATEKVETPRHFAAHRVQVVTSPKDEMLFLASTSYMVAPKSYKGLVESENSSAVQLPTKTASQNRPQVPSIKDNLHKLTKKERKQVAVLGAIAAKRWHIDIHTMNSMRYGARTVTSDFYLELHGDTLQSYLPYLGQVQVSQLSPSIGLNFKELVRQYQEGRPKSKYTQLDIDVRTREDSYHYVIEIYDSGEASIRVRGQHRDPISFDGTLETE